MFHDESLAARYRQLWSSLAVELRGMPYIAGLEPMSEPRSKIVAQASVRRFYEGVCGGIAAVDPRTPCVVGPTPYYKVRGGRCSSRRLAGAPSVGTPLSVCCSSNDTMFTRLHGPSHRSHRDTAAPPHGVQP